jgi:predicted dehydrogenase
MDYSGGQLTDWAGHHIDIAHWGLDFDRTGPHEVSGEGTYPAEGLWDAPTDYRFTCKYEGDVTIVVGSTSQIGFMGTKWHGDDGWIHVNRSGLWSSDPTWVRYEEIGPGDKRLYRSNDHVQNFIDCVKSRRETITPVETACRSVSVGHLGEIAMLTGRTIRWDPVSETILDDAGAAALLGRSYRKPWIL